MRFEGYINAEILQGNKEGMVSATIRDNRLHYDGFKLPAFQIGNNLLTIRKEQRR